MRADFISHGSARVSTRIRWTRASYVRGQIYRFRGRTGGISFSASWRINSRWIAVIYFCVLAPRIPRGHGTNPALSEVEGDESSAGTNARGKARAANFRPEETREQIGGRADRAAKKGGKRGKRLSMRCMERRG